jgi:hypothetical protein
LVLALMVLPALATFIPSAGAQALDQSIAAETPLIDSHGITLRLMTGSDMLTMREKVGTRVDGINYDVIVDGHHTGLAPPSAESWNSMVGDAWLAQAPVSLELSAPAAYDMSTNAWFPKVGNQASQGSCAAWAATYYCYGAVEAKDNGWTLSKSGNTSQLLSPAWTYNRVASRGAGGGSWMSDNFAVIKDWGVSTLATFPYVDTNDINWGSEAAWRNAPLHRGSSLVFLQINGDSTINAIKNLVAGDQPITFAIDANEFGAALADDYVISADEYNSAFTLNHAQTIVGYDDSKVVAGHADVGAFRVVNSWGSSWENGGYYWISYAAFKKIMVVGGNELCYITDISDYTPSLLAVWHYNNPPKRNVQHNLMIGNPSSYLAVKSPCWTSDGANSLPTFMICDISEFRSYYDSGTIKFSLEAAGGVASTISSFRIESYEGSYSPGAPTQVSAQSSQVPKATPGRLENNFLRYSPISPVQALDRTGIEVYYPGLTDWVGVDHTFGYGGSAMQAGDVGDSSSSAMQINVTGYSGVTFLWKVSSEQSYDYLRLYESATKKMEISGNVGWTRAWYNFTGPGTHVLKWAYEKSGATSSLQDGAWIDRLQLLSPDDAYEQNDVSGQAAILTAPSNHSNLVLLDDDWYKVALSLGDTFTATARFNGSEGNLDLYLYSTDATTLLTSSAHSSGDSESVSVVGALEAGYYYVKAVPAYSDIINYSLELERSSGLPDYGMTGSIILSSGTGSFSALSESNDRIVATVGQTLNGGVSYDFANAWPSTTVPLVLAYSWGANSSSYREVTANLSAGSGSGTATINGLVVPSVPGTYNLIFAFRNESDAAFVASATSTSHAAPSWDDGNDIARFSDQQIADAQSSGRCTVSWLMDGSWQDVKVPADAIKVVVIPEDHTPPITQVSCNGDIGSNDWYNSAVHVVLTPGDPGSGVNETRYRIDSSSWSFYSGAVLVSNQGQHLVEYYSTDLAGNVESVKSVLLKIDSGDPVSSADLQGTAGFNDWYVSEVRIDIASSDGVSGISAVIYNLDGSGERTYEGEFIVSLEGSHDLTYYALDVAGNAENEHTLQFNIDTSRPTVEGEAQGTAGVNGWFLSSIAIEIRGNDMVSGIDSIMYQLDGAIWTNYYSSVEVSQQGEHSISFYAIDHAGNQAEPVNLTFRIDSVLPTARCNVTGEQGQNGWFVGALSVNLTGLDDLSGITALMYRLDGTSWSEYSGDILIETEGQHTLEYFAIDLAGNNGTIESTILKLDGTAPVSAWHLTGILGQDGWYVSTVSVNATGQDGNGSGIALFEYRLDGGSWENYSEAIPVQSEGVHSMECRAIDVAGNVETAQVIDFMIDTIAPESSVSIDGSIGELGWYTTSVAIAIAADDGTSGISHTYMRVNEGEWILGNTSQFSDGVYHIEFYSTDVAGNSGPIGNVTVMSDLEAPLTTSHAMGTLSENGWFTSNVSLALAANDDVSGVDSIFYRLDGGDWIAYVGSIAFDKEGSSLIEYRSLDIAGNQEPLRSYEVKVDKAAPDSSVQITGESGAGGWYVSSLLINISAADEVSGVSSIDFRLDSGNWLSYAGQIAVGSCGAHLLQFRSKDIAGNVEAVKEVGFDIDSEMPTVSTQIDGRVFTANQISFNWTSNDSTSGVGAIELSLDGAAYQVLEGTQSNFTLQDLGDGQHLLSIRVTDLAGNKVVKELSFVVDTNPLSPQGPYGPSVLIALIGVAILVAVLLIRWARRR